MLGDIISIDFKSAAISKADNIPYTLIISLITFISFLFSLLKFILFSNDIASSLKRLLIPHFRLTHVLVVIADVDSATGQLVGARQGIGSLHLPVHLMVATATAASGGRQHRALDGWLLEIGRGYCAIASVLLLLLCISLVFSWFCKG